MNAESSSYNFSSRFLINYSFISCYYCTFVSSFLYVSISSCNYWVMVSISCFKVLTYFSFSVITAYFSSFNWTIILLRFSIAFLYSLTIWFLSVVKESTVSFNYYWTSLFYYSKPAIFNYDYSFPEISP